MVQMAGQSERKMVCKCSEFQRQGLGAFTAMGHPVPPDRTASLVSIDSTWATWTLANASPTSPLSTNCCTIPLFLPTMFTYENFRHTLDSSAHSSSSLPFSLPKRCPILSLFLGSSQILSPLRSLSFLARLFQATYLSSVVVLLDGTNSLMKWWQRKKGFSRFASNLIFMM